MAATQEAIQRYGKIRAEKFEEIRNSQTRLLEAFDLLSEQCDNIMGATAISNAFTHLWDLLTAEHERVLAMEKEIDNEN